jgi:hypothetical protein
MAVLALHCQSQVTVTDTILSATLNILTTLPFAEKKVANPYSGGRKLSILLSAFPFPSMSDPCTKCSFADYPDLK